MTKYYFAQEQGMSESNPESRQCTDCGAAFESLDELTAHYRQEHPESM
jgi:hypothetical protein